MSRTFTADRPVEFTIGGEQLVGMIVAVDARPNRTLAHIAVQGTPFLYCVPLSDVRENGPVGDPILPLEALRLEVLAWQAETFTQRTIRSVTAHLAKEGAELHAEPTDRLEYADVLMLAWSALNEVQVLAEAHGIDLLSAVRDKLAINKARTWGFPDGDGVVLHVSDPAPAYEYRVTEGQRKAWDQEPDLSVEGWERDPTVGDDGWQRHEFTETITWRRALR
jgi:hypothetical protein